ncbi:MAG: exodeoxyribonuclease VII large subunit [Deltaproteobacteria bacterium]|nr:MAG: exodeoxyribonuclease VII large subunit [Deltaproteobacteria bacterium]
MTEIHDDGFGGKEAGELPGPKVYTVSELTEEIRELLEGTFDFVWVEGEISNFRSPMSGHYYMVLKDEQAQIKAVMFRPQIRYLRFIPEDGMRVIARGRISVYAPRGDYQIVLDYLEPMGLGALTLAYEQLKRKLAAEGVFNPEIKKPLPYLPQRIALITSPTGAAVRDFLKVMGRRFANMEIIVVPVRVQGEGASAEIIEALDIVNRELQVDVVVITRGGGSLEDLWPFNSEELAYAIRKSSVPVVSAVGHEIDTTICDLAADLRAPTPSAAAEILAKEKETLKANLSAAIERMVNQMQRTIGTLADKITSLGARLKDPRRRLEELWMRLDEIHGRLNLALKWKLDGKKRRLQLALLKLLRNSPERSVEIQGSLVRQRFHSMCQAIYGRLRHEKAGLEALAHRVSDLSPLSILERGYSITIRLPQSKIVRSYHEVELNEKVGIILGSGSLLCTVQQTSSNKFPWEKQ